MGQSDKALPFFMEDLTKQTPLQQIVSCTIGNGTKIYNFVNLYHCRIGDDCVIGSFVEVQKNVNIGNHVKISSHSFLCEGVIVEDNVFIGHHVVFTNDKYPRATSKRGVLKTETDWPLLKTVVKNGASIGSNATILPGIIIGENAMVGAGAVVTKNVPSGSVVVGNPAKVISKKM